LNNIKKSSLCKRFETSKTPENHQSLVLFQTLRDLMLFEATNLSKFQKG
jgi:hypothetical protein